MSHRRVCAARLMLFVDVARPEPGHAGTLKATPLDGAAA